MAGYVKFVAMNSVILPIIILFGLLLTLLGVTGLVTPAPLIRLVNAFWNAPRALYLAVGLRLFLGVVLVLAAPQTRFPMAVQVIGILSVVGAISLPIIGREKLQRLVAWWTSSSAVAIRLWAMVALLFGLFLIYVCV